MRIALFIIVLVLVYSPIFYFGWQIIQAGAFQ